MWEHGNFCSEVPSEHNLADKPLDSVPLDGHSVVVSGIVFSSQAKDLRTLGLREDALKSTNYRSFRSTGTPGGISSTSI